MTPPAAAILALLFAGAGVRTAHGDALGAANWARMHGCGPGVVRSALLNSATLERAAARLAAGAPLQSTLTSLGYPAAQSSALHLSGSVSDADVTRALTTSFCSTLTNPQLREIGTARRGRDLWMVIAEPAAVPAAGDASILSRRILALVNEARRAGRRCGSRFLPPAAPLTLDPILSAAALAHSRDMAQHDEFDHRGHDGSSPQSRVKLAGYGAYRIVGENIAAGAMSASEVTQGWLDSPPHCENIMDRRFTQIGIAYSTNLTSSAVVYWTQDFAAPR